MDMYGNKLVIMIETKPLCASSSNLADMLAIARGWTPLILEVRGQRSRRSGDGLVVKLLACGARGPGFDTWSRHLNSRSSIQPTNVKGQGHNRHVW